MTIYTKRKMDRGMDRVAVETSSGMLDTAYYLGRLKSQPVLRSLSQVALGV